MKVSQLRQGHKGRRIEVTAVADSAVEHQNDFPKDSERLVGQKGTITNVVQSSPTAPCSQAWIDWDEDPPGSLSLAGEDEVEVEATPLADWEKANGETLIRAAVNGDLVLLRSTDLTTGKEVALLCAVTAQPGSVAIGIVPLATLIDGNPYELYSNPSQQLGGSSRLELPPGVRR